MKSPRPPRRDVLRLTVLVLSALLAFGCGAKEPAPPAPREPVTLKVTVTADADINPSPLDRPSPVVVRIFDLADAKRFQEADYMELQADPKAVLEDDFLAASEKIIVQPGQTATVEHTVQPGTTAAGFTAGYRDINAAVWQSVQATPEPPEVGWFSSPVIMELNVRLRELNMEVAPAEQGGE